MASELLKEWGLDYATLQEDEGVKGATNIVKALETIQTSTELGDKDKKEIADAISTFASLTEDAVRQQPLCEAAPKICEVLTEILLLPDDELEKYKKDAGHQDVAKSVSSIVTSYCYFSADFCKAIWPHIVEILTKVKDVPMKKPTALRSQGAPIVRLETIQALMTFSPPYGAGVTAPSGLIETLVGYIGKDKPASETAASAIQTLAATDSQLLETHMGAVFACYAAGVDSMKNTLMASYTTAYPKDPNPFHENIELIINMDFMSSSGMLYAIADKNGKVVAPYTERLVKMLEEGVQYGMESMILTILNGVANADPGAVYAHMDRIYNAGVKLPNCAITVAMVLGHCGKASDAEAPVKVVLKLCEMLTQDFGPHAPAVILSGIVNQFGKLSDRTLLDPYMDAIRSHEASAGQVVEKIKDWHAGRSLEDTTNRLDALEAKVNAMNDEFAAKCADFDEVSKMMDEKIADLKDFVGEVVKKLPQPYKMTVESGVKKTLILHFRCANTGGEVTTQTKQWNQWVKAGFGLMKLGKCAAVAAAGNPMALASGAGAVADIYAAFKTKEDKDFNTFIKQPFLTSAEQDRLIEQLRDANFFDRMTYDAQQGDWVLVESLSAEGNQKLVAKKAQEAETLASVEKKKGKNMGLGSVKDVARVAAKAADMQGIEIAGGVSASDAVSHAETAGSAAKNAKAAAAKVRGKGKTTEKPAAAAPAPAAPAPKAAAPGPGAGMERDGSRVEDIVMTNKATPAFKAAPVAPVKKSGFFGRGKANAARVAALEQRVAELERVVEALTKQQ